MATATDGSSFHDVVRLFSDAGEQIWPPSDPACTTAPTSSSSTHHAQSRWVETHLAVHAKHHLCISSVPTPSASHHAHHMGHHTQRPQIAQPISGHLVFSIQPTIQRPGSIVRPSDDRRPNSTWPSASTRSTPSSQIWPSTP
ncbi:hypothetical protein ACLOJK_036499 [Asimina triloba]